MVITLYKNCVLNDKYKDIFCNRTILESYLATLTSTTITIADTFSRNKDSLYIEDVTNTLNVQDYNYLKVSDNMITFYAFITSIDWLAEAYIINYKEDIIANHFDKIKVRNGLQTRTRIKKKFNNGTQSDITLFKEPLQSEGNDSPTITKVLSVKDGYVKYYGDNTETTITHGTHNDITFICKLQLYTLTSGGEYSKRKPIIYKACCNPVYALPQSNWLTNFNQTVNTDNLMDWFVNHLINEQPTGYIGGYRYEIDTIYAVPNYLINKQDIVQDESTIIKMQYEREVSDGNGGTTTVVEYNGIGFIPFETQHQEVSYLRSELDYDRKLFAVGFINKPFNVVVNGTKTKIKIVTELYGYNFSMYMYIQNNIYEITDLFEVDMPFQPITASALQIRRMQLAVENNDLQTDIKNANIQKSKTTMKQILSGVNFGLNAVTSIFGGLVGGGSLGNVSGLIGSGTGAIGDIIGGALEKEKLQNNISNTEYKVSQINGAMYSNASVVANKVSYKTAENGLLAFYLSEDNTSQITALQALSGYIVNELVNDNLNDTYKNYLINNNTYDVIEFSEVNIYGTISQNYLRAIESILNAGVRIWGSTSINV